MAATRRNIRHGARALLAALPTAWRFSVYRRLIDCNPVEDETFELRIAQSQEDLEACFGLLHDAYVASGFMLPHPSGLRVTPYHALPTTTTLCAKIGGQVVGTISIVRDGVFGFPMQSAFDLSSVRSKEGRIAEISALAVRSDYRKTGGAILFPLMKFMYEYCTQFFDTQHLVIAVSPNKMEMYESLLFFRRLPAQVVEHYDFANGVPALGATLDLKEAAMLFERAYARQPPRRNLYRFFVQHRLPQIKLPARPWHTSNDPVLTPDLLDHFFNRRTQGFDALDERNKLLLHSIYAGAAWAEVLPVLSSTTHARTGIRRHPRFSLRCPTMLHSAASGAQDHAVEIVELSAGGFRARSKEPLPADLACTVVAELGVGIVSTVQAKMLRLVSDDDARIYAFRVDEPDSTWQRFVDWLDESQAQADRLPTDPPKDCGSA